jgi:putative Holliday junction resolvase
MNLLLALDVGTKTIGIAIGAVGAGQARVHSTLSRKGVRKDVARLVIIARESKATGVVVGMPYTLDGAEGRSARLARQIGVAMGEASGLPVFYQDERYSTLEAEDRLRARGISARRQRAIIDQEAAVVILGDWFAQNPLAG